MRLVRLFGVVLTILTAGLLLATSAGAQPPSKLTDHLTDSTGVLTDSDRAAVSSAIDRLYRDRHIQLWVVYVDNFSRFKPENWADRTRTESKMGDHDALLAVATNTKLYTFTAPGGLTAAELNSLQSNRIGPAVGAKDWSGAAVAAADGLNNAASSATSSPKRNWLPIAIGVGVGVVVIVALLVLYRRRRAARQLDAGAGQRSIEGRDLSAEQALSIADARLRQISGYVAKHRRSIGTKAQTRLDEAKRHLDAAHAKEASNGQEAVAHANEASTLAAQAQTLANADVLAAHRTSRR
jgi:uncharacterized membrane protein YgcG